jgi:uncharacterized membrane protein
MSTIEQSIEVDAPVRTVYDPWTQFEEFPRCLDGIDEVTPLDATHLHWKASVGGKTNEWDAEITEQLPDKRVAWKSTSGTANAGVVTFHRLDEHRTKVLVQLDWEPDGVVETLGSAVGSDSRRVQGDLERFKELIESRGAESGAWRGEVKQQG